MKEENVIAEKSMDFAIKIVTMYKYLSEEKKEFVLSKQLLRSGTSIGANVSESENAQSRADFRSKLCIALKEAGETRYWLELLFNTEYIEEKAYKEMHSDCIELIRILTAIIKKL